MRTFMKCRGSVSVFLVIILVPIIVVCSVFVDAGRIKLAKSLTDYASDLTLTTGLSYYDLELNDYYGILASSQSEEEFFNNSQTYFEACMVSQGISTTDAAKWAESLREIVEGDSDIVDLLQIEVAGNYSLAPVKGANLANAAIIKSDIVDFMKYRAPIELLADGSGIVSKLQQIGEMEKIIPVETALQDEKQEYYEAECRLLKRCGDIYIDFNGYDSKGMTAERLAVMKAYLYSLEAEYKELHMLLVMNLYNGEGRGQFSSVESLMVMPGVSTGEKIFDAGDLKQLIGTCRGKITEYDKAKDALQAKLDTIPFKTYQDSYYEIQYWIQMEDSISAEYGKYINSLNAMLAAWAALENGYANRDRLEEDEWDWVEDEHGALQYQVVKEAYDVKDTEYSGEGYATIEQSYEQIKLDEIQFRKNQLSSLEIWNISKKMEEISTAAVASGKMDSGRVTQRLAEISAQLEAYRSELQACDDLLKDIYDGLGKLHNDIVSYDEEYGEWKGLAQGSAGYRDKSEIVDTDLTEIAAMEANTAIAEEPDNDKTLVRVKINEAEVTACMERVNNVRALLGTYIDSVDSFTYGGKRIKDIREYKTLKKQSGVQEAGITVDRGTLEAYGEALFTEIFVKPADTNYHNITDNNNPDFTVSKPAFYAWLHKQFDGKELTDKNKADKVLDRLKEKMEAEKKKSEGEEDHSDIADKEIKGLQSLPSEGAGGSALGTSGKEDIDGVTDTTSLFGDLDLVNILTDGRDNLYALSYIMSMFSYDTYVKENKYILSREGVTEGDIYQTNDGKISPFKAPDTCYRDIYARYDEIWKNPDTTFTANKSLTNKLRNAEFHYAFGNEVEYIIYGGKNAENKAAAYGTIFGIRYAMNIGPVFSLYWNMPSVISIASSVSVATSGIIPVSLVKLIICLGMTAAETAVDISYLKAGLPVQFAKRGEKDLFLVLNLKEMAKGATELAGGFIKNEGKNQPSGLVLSYSDYLSLFLFIAICTNEQSIYLRTADVIQCNMQLRNSAFLMSKAVAYYELSADMRVKPLLLATPWARQSGSDILDTGAWNTFQIKQIKGY